MLESSSPESAIVWSSSLLSKKPVFSSFVSVGISAGASVDSSLIGCSIVGSVESAAGSTASKVGSLSLEDCSTVGSVCSTCLGKPSCSSFWLGLDSSCFFKSSNSPFKEVISFFKPESSFIIISRTELSTFVVLEFSVPERPASSTFGASSTISSSVIARS